MNPKDYPHLETAFIERERTWQNVKGGILNYSCFQQSSAVLSDLVYVETSKKKGPQLPPFV